MAPTYSDCASLNCTWILMSHFHIQSEIDWENDRLRWSISDHPTSFICAIQVWGHSTSVHGCKHTIHIKTNFGSLILDHPTSFICGIQVWGHSTSLHGCKHNSHKNWAHCCLSQSKHAYSRSSLIRIPSTTTMKLETMMDRILELKDKNLSLNP